MPKAKRPIPHSDFRRRRWYAVLDVPLEVRHIIGKAKFVQSTKTGNDAEAAVRIPLLVAGWRSKIEKARGMLPNPKDSFWESLRRDYISAGIAGEHGTQLAIEDVAEKAAGLVADPAEGARLWKFATDQMGTLLAPLVLAWKDSLRLKQKTIDQRHRDVCKMAAIFISVEALQPRDVKAWTDKLVADGASAATMARIGEGCRSLWTYLRLSGTVPMIAPDPFDGSFKLAGRIAPRTKTGRTGTSYTPGELASLYVAAKAGGDTALADLIALGAYTGARIEELCALTSETAKDGVFRLGTKTPASKRDCPIHPALAPLVARMLRESTDGYLVPSTSQNQYGTRSDALTKRFGRLKKAQGYGRSHVFHTARNTLITLMQQAGVPEGIAADIVGHKKQTMTYGLYGSGSAKRQKLEAISQAAYPPPLDSP